MTLPARQQLTTEEQSEIRTLSAAGWSNWRIAQKMKRSPHTIQKYLSSPSVVVEVQAEKANLADSFEDLSRRMVTSITDADIKKLDAYRRTIAAAAATDKSQLLRGQPTSINLTPLLDVVQAIRNQRDARAEEIQRQIRQEREQKRLGPTVGLPQPEPEPHSA